MNTCAHTCIATYACIHTIINTGYLYKLASYVASFYGISKVHNYVNDDSVSDRKLNL